MSQSQSSSQEKDAAEQQAWALLLQHPALQTDTPSMCRLLCASHGMRQTIHDHVRGQLHVNVSAEHDTRSSMGAKLSPWLRSHAALLKSLIFTQLSGLECSRPEQQQQFAHVTVGLAAAAQQGAALQIRSLTSNVCGQAILDILPLFGSSLTNLELGPFCTDELHKLVTKAQPGSSMQHRAPQDPLHGNSNAVVGVDTTPPPVAAAAVTAWVAAQEAGSIPQQAAAAATAAEAPSPPPTSTVAPTATPTTLLFPAAAEATGSQLPVPAQQQQVPHWVTLLSSLSALSCLTLKGYAANSLLPAVQACAQLTSLTLCNLLCSKAQLLHNLPAQLQSLCVSVDPDFTSWQRKQRQPVLSHLGSLSALTCTGEGLFAVQANEVLPPSLVELVVCDCPKAAPLLPLRGLQVLAMQASTMDAQQLKQLRGGLPSLRAVQLGYERGNMEAITAAAPGWPTLAGCIRGLDLRVYPGPLPAKTLAHLAQLGPGLTRLSISGFSVQVEASPAVFAAVLHALPGLQELKLAYLKFQDEAVQPVQAVQPMQAVQLVPAVHPMQAQPPVLASPRGRSRMALASVAAAAGTAANAAAAAAAAVARGGFPAVGAGGAVSTAALPAAVSMAAAAAAAPAGPDDADVASCTLSEGVDLVVLMQQIAALPALTSLSLHSMGLTGPPVAALAAAGPQLSTLRLNECDLCDADVALLAVRLTGLRKLALNWNFAVKSEALRCLSQLKGLRELNVCCGTTRHEAVLAALQQQMPGLVAVSQVYRSCTGLHCS